MNLSLNKSIDFFLLVCIAVLPFSNALINIFFAIFSILKITEIIKNKTFKDFNVNKIIFIVFLLFLCINASVQGSFNANIKFWKFIPILLLGTIFISNKSDKFLKKFRNISLVSCILYVLFVIARIIIFYFTNHYLPFGNGNEVNQILIIDRPYLGFLIALNIIFAFNNVKNSIFKGVNYAIIFGLTLFLIIISARLSILTVVITSCIYFTFFNKISLKRKAIILACFITSIIALTLFNPQFKERTKHYSYEEFTNYEPRFVIWQSVKNIINNTDYNQFIGYGNYNLIEEYLVINYEEQIVSNNSKREFYIDEKFNTHSQFLDYLLFGGSIGLILFIIYLVKLFTNSINDFVNISIVIAFILFFLIENVFHRQLGIYVFIFYINTLKIYESKNNLINRILN